ncbi:MAG: type I restriction enzyme HsdR N-terminal domain-containing protein [Chitinophagaceae bacterium]|nr:type I restriction enzyme HsdR N-terminal domain-containing protein [Chitinophagaceae bacterium]
MVSVTYPEPDFKIKTHEYKDYLFDPIRKKWVVLTPEEWVRQNFIQYLVKEKKYPTALIGLEKQIELGDLKKRFDILVYNKAHQPWMMIECKEMNVALDEKVLEQLLRYSISVPVSYLVITNGRECFAWHKSHQALSPLDILPLHGE